MRRHITRALALVGLAAALVLSAVGAAATNNASWNVSYSVATSTSLVNNTASLNAGAVIPGNLSAGGPDSLTITSNDPAGVQLTAFTGLAAGFRWGRGGSFVRGDDIAT